MDECELNEANIKQIFPVSFVKFSKNLLFFCGIKQKFMVIYEVL